MAAMLFPLPNLPNLPPPSPIGNSPPHSKNPAQKKRGDLAASP